MTVHAPETHIRAARPQDGFIDAGSGGGIGWGLCDDITHARILDERVIEPRRYHTIAESKNGQGPPPILTDGGWLHLAHGVRNTSAGCVEQRCALIERSLVWRRRSAR